MFRKKRPLSLKTCISREMHLSRRKIFVGDKYLHPIPSKEMGEFLAIDTTDKVAWMKKVTECNTFALYLRANAKRWFTHYYGWNAAVGTLWVKKYKNLPSHAFNFHIDPKYRFHYVEPQTDAKVYLDKRKVIMVII